MKGETERKQKQEKLGKQRQTKMVVQESLTQKKVVKKR